MTRIKLCGLTRPCDIEAANELRPDYVGFVFARGSRRYVPPEAAEELRRALAPEIQTVGVFVNEEPETVAELFGRGIINVAQLHGSEDEAYIRRLRERTDMPVIKAFCIDAEADVGRANRSPADFVLLDSGEGGTGRVFDWELLRHVRREYFLAGGLGPDNVHTAVELLRPYAVDVSSGIETGGLKDGGKMAAFVAAVRKGERL